MVCSALITINSADLVAQTGALSLEEAIEYARSNNSDILNARLEVEISKQEVKSIVATGLPQINANAQFVHNVQIAAQQFPDFLSPAVYGVLIDEGLLPADRFKSGQPQTVQFGAPSMLAGNVTLNQLLFDGTFFLGLSAAKEYVNLTKLVSEKKEIDVVESVTKAYYLAVLTAQVHTMLSDNLRTTQEVRDQTAAMLEAGVVEQLDLDRLDFALANLNNQIQTTEYQKEMSIQMLKVLIGMDVSADLTLSTSIDQLSAHLEVLPQDAAVDPEKRIEYQILQEQLVLDSLNIKRYKVGYYPSLTLSANHQQNSFASKAEFVDLGKTWNPGTSYSLNLSIPIFDGLYKKSKVEQARLKQMQDMNNLETLVNSVNMEVKQSALNYSIQKNNLETQDKNRQLAKSIFEKTRIRFNEGMGSSFELIQAENDLYRAEIEYTNTLYNLLVAYIELQKALGEL